MEKPNQAEPSIKESQKKKWLVLLGLCLIAAAMGAAFWYTQPVQDSTLQKTNTTKKPAEKKPVASDEDPVLKRFITPTTGEAWLPSPKEIGPQGFFQNTEYAPDSETDYYEVGTRVGNTVIMTISNYGIGSYTSLFERSPSGKVSIILQPDSQAVYNQEDVKSFVEGLNPAVEQNNTVHYDSLSLPRAIKLDKGYVLTKSPYPTVGDLIRADIPDQPQSIEVKKLGASTLMRSEKSYADTKLTSIGYFIKSPINTQIDLVYEPLEIDSGRYQWQKGYAAGGDLRPIARGCGGVGSSVTRSEAITADDVEVVAKSPSGQDVYALKDPNHPLMQKAFEEFKEYAGTSPEVSYFDITKDEFVKQHAIVVYKDNFGQYLVYAREDLSPGYGCAKPVVYLYPTKTTKVNVRVGADVKISEPLYNPRTGWNVIARPDGRLVVDGNDYSSLFWEGPGIGEYPSITSGAVVKRDNAVSTIKQQLAQQGFNRIEIEDFVEYWHDKLPNKPYVRLSWLTTTQMNELAPLNITPKPNTTLRTFLDFSGLDEPITLPKQQLEFTKRQGFTVVEWGGLSPKKLY